MNAILDIRSRRPRRARGLVHSRNSTCRSPIACGYRRGFRRLAKISQLGLVSLVYPAALHTVRALAGRLPAGGSVSQTPGTTSGSRPYLTRTPSCFWPRPAAIWDTGRSATPSRTSACRAYRRTSCCQQSAPGGEVGGVLRSQWHQPARRGCPVERKTADQRRASWPTCCPAPSTSTRWTTVSRQPPCRSPLRAFRSAALIGGLCLNATGAAWPSPIRARRPPNS